MKPEPVKMETRVETRTTKFVVISEKWIFVERETTEKVSADVKD